MNCPGCGKRNPPSLTNCVHCDHFLQAGSRQKDSFVRSSSNNNFLNGQSRGFDPSKVSTSGPNYEVTSQGVVARGPLGAALGLLTIGILAGGAWFFYGGGYDNYMLSQGKVKVYQAVWCSTNPSAQAKSQLQSAGFSQIANRTSRSSSRASGRLIEEPGRTTTRYCWAKDLGTDRGGPGSQFRGVSIESRYIDPPAGSPALKNAPTSGDSQNPGDGTVTF